MTDKRIFCWDTSVFIAYLQGGRDARTKEEMAGLLEVVHLAASHQATVITSTNARTEVLGGTGDPGVRAALGEIFARQGFLTYQVSDYVADLAGDIRVETRKLKPKLRLDTADAQFIATAIVYHAEALHSFDHHMLRLDRMECVRGLRICHPHGRQMELGI